MDFFYDKEISIYSYGEYDDEVRPGVVIQREGYKLGVRVIIQTEVMECTI